MNPSVAAPSNAASADKDLAEQALPGHGIPSQDPDPAAQILLGPEEADREAHSALMGGGVVAGVAAGAAIGVLVAGPVGVMVGATLGGVAGALGGATAAAAATASPAGPDSVATGAGGTARLPSTAAKT
jgi:phage-related tail protein